MNKKSICVGFLILSFLLGFKSVTTKEAILFESRKIKASLSQEPLSTSKPKFTALLTQEKLVYRAKYLGIPIGKFIIAYNGKMMLNGQEVYCFELSVKTLPFFSILFKTKDRYVSYMETKDLAALRYEEYVKGGTFLESRVDFDYENHTATYTNFISQEENTVKIPDKIFDILSGGFYLRMMDLELGDMPDFYIYADKKNYNFVGFLSSKTKVNVPPYGKQDAYCFKPYLFIDGKQVIKISAEVFFSQTAPMTPLHAILKTFLGNVHVVLVEGYENS